MKAAPKIAARRCVGPPTLAETMTDAPATSIVARITRITTPGQPQSRLRSTLA
jgi:hypothetical protein